MSDVVLVAITDRVATVTLSRPEARNALNAAVRRALPDAMRALDDDDAVDVVILTGADPVFCAGFDLKELAAGGSLKTDNDGANGDDPVPLCPFPAMRKPVIGAINGPAVTGGLELALQCDFLVASDRARFADTHGRVGMMPAWGLSVLLPQAVGVRKAREMSVTGNYLTADEALAWGLVNYVVAHDQLLPFARRLAADIVSNNQSAVQRMLATYDEVTATTASEGFDIEAGVAKKWLLAAFDPVKFEGRRAAIVERGRAQTH